MNFQLFGKKQAPTLLLIPGLGVSYEIFLPLIRLMEDRFRIIAVEVDGFTLGKHTRFTSVDDQASQIIAYVQTHYNGLIGGWTNTQYTGKIGQAEIGAQFDSYNYRYTERNRIDEAGQYIVKGGAWDTSRDECRTEYSDDARNGTQGYANVGFRVVRVDR